jgi:hypothetical protein
MEKTVELSLIMSSEVAQCCTRSQQYSNLQGVGCETKEKRVQLMYGHTVVDYTSQNQDLKQLCDSQTLYVQNQDQ